MADGNKAITEDKVKVHPKVKTPKLKVQEEVITKAKAVKSAPEKSKDTLMFDTEGPWTCSKCTEEGELPQEFVLYYLYRKHMTDVHNEVFDVRLCKYCGRRCSKHNLMMYHLYTKHGLKPPASYNFPKCNLCPYIALSTQKLAQHKKHHDSKEMQCQECKLAFTSQQTLTAHIQIMGHCTKPGKPSYDCQYCTKKLHSAINLFSHIKNSHLKEAKKDGMVSLDEMDENDDMENEEEEEEEEYILPEAPSEVAIQKDKVKIISNVKVPANVQQGRVNAQARPVPLEPSSEAEALTNVASGIATSLGLVDIVVLDENQQYITLQQENQSGQSEFILPELQSNEGSFAGQVITTQHNTVLPQGMLQSASQDIGSTDELVMVLTDHDYQDEQEGATDNSNIVVLYSHPVDGQQGQFITSQGNLLVNSHTGMLEIRNGATIATTTASQMVVNSAVDAPIESIEMIQREIDGHGELKPEPFYEEEPKPEVDQEYRESDQAKESEVQQEQHQDQEQYHEEQEDSEVGVIETEQNVSDENTTIEYQESNEESQHYVHTENSEEQIVQEDTQSEVKKDTIDGVETVYEEPMEVEESEETVQEDAADKETAVVNEEQPKDEILTPQETEQEETETKSKSEKDQVSREETGVDVPPELDRISEHEESGTLVLNDPSSIFISHDADSCKEESIVENVPEAMEVDGKQQMEADEKEVEAESQESAEIEEVDGQHEKVVSEGGVTKPAEPQSSQEVASHSIEYQHQSETSNSQYNDDDENSQSSQGTAQSQENTIDSQSNINQTILEDWEDTDSQQSEKQRVAMKEAAENVNKLMDDWEEEDDEEDKREGN